MRLTTKGRYAVTALLDVAIQAKHSKDAVALSYISKRQSISVSYLEQLFSKLRKNGLVISTRGANGGYRLAKPAEYIDVLAIISAVDESVDAMQCKGSHDCQNGAMCLTHDLWNALSKNIESYLKTVTLAQLLTLDTVQSVFERQQQVAKQQIDTLTLSASEVNPA